MPSLSLNIGLNNGRKLPFGGGAAPSGIPVASTNTIIVVDTAISGNFTGTYQKESSIQYRNLNNEFQTLSWDSTSWYFNDADAGQFVYPTPFSADINYIATTGWPTQTLTAA
jgi:hypothetical protein